MVKKEAFDGVLGEEESLSRINNLNLQPTTQLLLGVSAKKITRVCQFMHATRQELKYTFLCQFTF